MTDSTGNGGKDLLRARAVADEYGFTYRHIRQLVTERRISHYKIGKIIYIDRGEFEAWLAEQKVEARS